MSLALVLAVMVVLAVWVAAAIAFWHSGPGRIWRRTYCPRWGVSAKVFVQREEAGFGSVATTDILKCSVCPGGEVNCNKECMRWV